MLVLDTLGCLLEDLLERWRHAVFEESDRVHGRVHVLVGDRVVVLVELDDLSNVV